MKNSISKLVMGIAICSLLIVLPGLAIAESQVETAHPGGFLSGPNAGDPLDIALDYIRQNKRSLGLTEDDLADLVVKEAIRRTNAFYTGIWPAYREKVENTNFKWFKDYEPIEMD